MLYLRQSGSERLSISHDRNPTAKRLSWLRRCCGFGLGCVQGTIILDEGQELHGQKHSGETYFSISRRAGGRYRTQHTYSPVFERGQHAAAGQYRQEMKWGCFVKKVDLSSTQGALCTVSVFFILHFTYLGAVRGRTQRTPPRAYGPLIDAASGIQYCSNSLRDERWRDTTRYDTRCYFSARSKADMSRLNLPHGNDN